MLASIDKWHRGMCSNMSEAMPGGYFFFFMAIVVESREDG
jgi:hypothetical protein